VEVAVVAAEQLVSTISGEGNRDELPGVLGEQIGRQTGGVAVGLIQGRRNSRGQLDHLGPHKEFVMLGPQVFGHLPREHVLTFG